MSAKYKQYLITFNLYDGTMRSVPIEIPIGDPGEPGGYYKPETEQISDTEFRVSFIPSKDGMPPVDPVTMYSFSPRLTVTETEEGAEVTATDNFGTNTVVILNGKNGKTPVKGIDYSDGYSIYGLNDKLFAPTDEELMTMHDISLVKTEGRTLQKNDFVISNNGILGRVAGFASNNTKAVILPILAVGGSDGFSPTATVTRETDGVKITITDKNGTTTQTVPIGAEGNSIYYMDSEEEYPVPDDGGIHFNSVSKSLLSNGGSGIKVGDIIVASNGTLCKVKRVSDKNVSYDPIGTIKGVVSEYVGYSVYYLSLNAEYETESKQYLASKTYLSNDGNGVKIGDLLISSNGVLCKVTSVGESLVHYESIANIGGNVDAYVGYSTYYVDLPFNGLEPIYVSTNKISNNGAGIKIGDIVIFSDGTLCEVTEVTHRGDGSGIARCAPKSNIGGTGSDVLVVTVSDNIASHSPAEIGEAYSEGKAVYLLNNRYVIPLSYYRDDVAYFNIPLNLNGTEPDTNLILRQYSVNADKSVSLSGLSRNLPPCPTDEDEGKVLTAKNGEFVWSEHYGGNVAYDEAQNLTDAQKAQARENIGAQPNGNYLTEVPEGYAKTSEIPTDDHINSLIYTALGVIENGTY